MAEGDLVQNPYQYEFNGLLFGAKTNFTVTKIGALLGLPTTVSDDTDNTLAHGAVPGSIRMNKRVLPIDFKVKDTPFTEANMRLLRRAFQPPPLYNPRLMKKFVFQRPGEVKQYLNCRCERRDFDSDFNVARGQATGSVQLIATDPVIYSMIQKNFAVTLAAAAVTGTGSLSMLGDHTDGVDCIFHVSGPARNPRIQRTGAGAGDTFIFAIDIDIAAGETLIVDTDNRTAGVYTTAGAFLRDAFAKIRLDSDWFTLIPDVNTMTYTRSSAALTGAASTLTIYWRDGWA